MQGMRFSCTARAAVSLPRTITISLQSSKGCVPPAPLVHSSVPSLLDTVNNYPTTTRAIVSLSNTVNNHPRDDAILLHHSCSRQSIRYGPQSSKGCASPVPLVQSSVNWVRLQSSEGCLLEVPLVQSSAYWVRSTIIQEMRLSCIRQSSRYSLPDTVYNHLRDTPLIQSPVH